MKNKPDSAQLGGSYLFNEIKKRTPKSRETIPLNFIFVITERKTSKKLMKLVFIMLDIACSE
jgi:hypothetical protein